VPTESESDVPPRSTSTTSSLDPYYFTIHTPSQSPVPLVPHIHVAPKTPDMRNNASVPATPARDPAAIDRRGLVGVGELATPRWTRTPRTDDEFEQNLFVKPVLHEEERDVERDIPGSPWTIEAVDEDGDVEEDYDHARLVPPFVSFTCSSSSLLQVPEVNVMTRTVRSRPSVAEESGGEEILYPRQRQSVEHKFPSQQSFPSHITPRSSSSTNASFDTPLNHQMIHRSHDLEKDQAESIMSNRGSSPSEAQEKVSVRRHRSLGVSSPTSQKASKERRRDTTNLNFSKENPLSAQDGHSRHLSASSSSSGHADNTSRRVLTTDFSHLPPSPSSSSIQQFLRSPGSASGSSLPSSHGPRDHTHTSNVAQSLLRGTQEGWSGMDDEATAEALRKLDGLSGKSAHASARVSISGSRANSLSRPGTPAKTGAHWESTATSDGKRSSKRASTHTRPETGLDGRRDSTSVPASNSAKIVDRPSDSGNDLPTSISVSDDTRSSPAQEKSSKKSSARLSYNAKRGSTSSTNYTASSRDSGSVSTNTSLTSISATSGRQSLGKSRRNSTEVLVTGESPADIDRAAPAVQEAAEHHVPPVPPLPKDLANYRSPQTSHALVVQQGHVDEGEMVAQDDVDPDHTVSLNIPPARTPSKRMSPIANGYDQNSGYLSTGSGPAPLKTPSKKWSFTNAFKLSNSPSIASMKEKSPSSPRSATFGNSLRRSTSKDKSLAIAAVAEAWSTIHPDAMASESSLISVSSVGSPPNLLPPYVLAARTPDSAAPPSRAGTASSVSTNHTASLPSLPHASLSPTSSIRRGSSKRLTPSSIPFFRRSSSQSMQFPPSGAPLPTSISPTISTGSYGSARQQSKANSSPVKENNLTSFSTPAAHRKSSVLSLGLPSLLKGSSSRKSFHGEKSDNGKESERDSQKARQKEEKKLERSRSKKDEKDRSESRISVLMGRKRGKVC
jgi:dual specificity tyrosine-phosphorylation-regulated kinase 2/3/4